MQVRFRAVIFSSLALGVLLACSSFVGAQDNMAPADNTKLNQRDKNASEPTADQQPNAAADRTVTQKIRQSLIQDKELSTYAHNVKIITRNGMVTLKGPVRSEDEKKTVAAKATEIAGDSNVTNNLDVKPKN
jgi:hyperosmotically inducible periplasmic protein